ncbi:peptidase M18 [Leucosporidium creatinivorum]|uniref:aspartyl aminopeptidase n=1 Tax=Leucosporidium creatinivorum TaxID=106004 RepID=A0A1Y2FMT8_9BASI|nr:peptidase M18 [Leucosporidium creatinivorum]
MMSVDNLGPAKGFVSFVNDSPTPFHAVAQSVARLESVGFKRLTERDSWAGKLVAGGKYYVTRNQSSIIAFTVPLKVEKEGLGFSIVGCHTDSPRFIIKPVSRREKGGFAEVGVETYGGGIWATWLDRDLGIAGRVTLSGLKSASGSEYSSHLLLHRQPILRMPTIAIHLDRTQNEKLAYNPETQQVPILALASKELNKAFAEENKSNVEVDFADPLAITSHHHPILMHTISQALTESLGETISPTQIHDFELSLFDVQPSTIGGALSEFIFSPRIDNLFSSYAAVSALAASVEKEDWGHDGRVAMIALWDNEEVGSVSAYGAESNFIESVLERVAVALKTEEESATEAYQRTLAKSFLLSTDMGHSLHPSFPEKHEEMHRPLVNSGPAIKTNAKQRYASTAQTTFALRRIAALASVPLQEYEVRNDMACGSTIGPLVSKIGLRTVDIGCPQLSMHSIRETAGTKDMAYLQQLFLTFFGRFGEVDDLNVD